MNETKSEQPGLGSKALWLIGIWLLPGVLICVQEATYAQANGAEQLAVGRLLVHFLPVWLPWAVFTPLIFRLTYRLPLKRGNLAQALPAHLVACLCLAAAHILLLGLLRTHFPPAPWTPTDLGVWLRRTLWSAQTQVEVIAYCSVVFAAMAQAARERGQRNELRASQLESQLAGARLAALRSQLQPHFLFNTLNSIDVLMGEDRAAAGKMLHCLSDLLRKTLDSPEQTHSLEAELEQLGCYLDIERVRFSDRLQVELQVSAAAMDCQVPSLLLQPLVENAIRHGIAPVARGGKLLVSADVRKSALVIEVQDDGVGLGAYESDGIGLGNSKARLAELYGERASLELEERPGGGTLVRLALPEVREPGA